MNRQLAPARPIALNAGLPAPLAPAAPALPQISVSSSGPLMMVISGVIMTPVMFGFFLMMEDRRHPNMLLPAICLAAVTALTFAGMFAWQMAAVSAKRKMLKSNPLRIGTIAHVDVQRYPAGMYVNKSNVSGFLAHVDTFIAETGTRERCRIALARTRMPIAGETVIVSSGPAGHALVAIAMQHGWVGCSPFKTSLR